MKYFFGLNFSYLIVFAMLFFTCRNGHKNAGSFPEYEDVKLKITAASNVNWNGNASIKTSAIIQSMKLIFELRLDYIKPELYGFDIKKYNNTDLHYSISFNNDTLLQEFIAYKENMKSGMLYNDMNDSSGIFSESKPLNFNSAIKLLVPVYFMRKFKEGKDVQVKVRVWQNYFISDKIYDETGVKEKSMADVRDTIKKKLINNVYTFSFKMPAIYKTEIVCDSFALQNNKEWAPGGSDNTVFKSSYPDLFYLIRDFGYFDQFSSHIEKSTARFETGDTLPIYRYKKHEPFTLQIFDYDFLSKNDLLADTLLDPDQMADNKTIVLKFGHVDRFYFRKKDFGKIN